LPRSGSTWVYNVARHLLAQSNRPHTALFTDSFNQLPAEEKTRLFLVKSHTADDELRSASTQSSLPMLISVRDPRDAIASAIAFTSARFEVMLDLVCASAEVISRCLDYSGAIVFRYEDGFIGQFDTIERIAAALDIPDDGALFKGIQEDLRVDVVRSKIERLIEAGHFGPVPDSSKFDPVSHWHPSHIADGRIGKYKDLLAADQVAVIEDRLSGFMSVFYPEA
jgi:hypothetical protein